MAHYEEFEKRVYEPTEHNPPYLRDPASDEVGFKYHQEVPVEEIIAKVKRKERIKSVCTAPFPNCTGVGYLCICMACTQDAPLDHHAQDCPLCTVITSKPRKDTQGKPAGARWCYIAGLADMTDNMCIKEMCWGLDNLINTGYIDKGTFLFYCGLAHGNKKLLFDGVIAVRRKALESGKYVAESYKEPIDKDLLLDAMARHLIAYMFIGHIDTESDENHIAHIVANLIMYTYQVNHHE